MMHEDTVADATRLPAQAWSQAPVAPWSRWAARSVDAILLGFSAGIVIELTLIFAFGTSLDEVVPFPLLQGVLVLVLAGLASALMYGFTSTTPGKFLFGVRIEDSRGAAPGLKRALLREADVLIRGVGLGIPVIALITQVVAYTTLTSSGQSSWDGEARGTVVLYRAPGPTRTMLALLGIVLLLGGYAWIIMMNLPA